MKFKVGDVIGWEDEFTQYGKNVKHEVLETSKSGDIIKTIVCWGADAFLEKVGIICEFEKLSTFETTPYLIERKKKRVMK